MQAKGLVSEQTAAEREDARQNSCGQDDTQWDQLKRDLAEAAEALRDGVG